MGHSFFCQNSWQSLKYFENCKRSESTECACNLLLIILSVSSFCAAKTAASTMKVTKTKKQNSKLPNKRFLILPKQTKKAIKKTFMIPSIKFSNRSIISISTNLYTSGRQKSCLQCHDLVRISHCWGMGDNCFQNNNSDWTFLYLLRILRFSEASTWNMDEFSTLTGQLDENLFYWDSRDQSHEKMHWRASNFKRSYDSSILCRRLLLHLHEFFDWNAN